MLCGIDEAGRGCLAGPLVIAGVVLTAPVLGLADSKKLTATKREALFEPIRLHSRHHIALFPAEEIDARGLSACLKRGIEAIVEAVEAQRYLMDGNSSFGVAGVETMIKADASVLEVSAASILAKVTKDRVLAEAGAAFPQFDFAGHQGYGTKKHIGEIRAYGYTPLHRKSFRVKTLEQPTLF